MRFSSETSRRIGAELATHRFVSRRRDVQGHEGHVFAGGAELFSRDIPVLSEVWPYGILRSGMELEQFCRVAQRHWSSYWVWRRAQRYVQYSITDLPKFCEELGSAGAHDDVIFTHD
jgi:hypothetical protein